jgi:hypothetical protein
MATSPIHCGDTFWYVDSNRGCQQDLPWGALSQRCSGGVRFGFVLVDNYAVDSQLVFRKTK